MPPPQFWPLMRDQMLAPFFAFQCFCVALWCLDEYWHYALLTLLMLFFFETTVVKTRMRTLSELRRLGAPPQRLLALRDGKWDPVPPRELLPGDVVSIGRPSGLHAADQVVPADMLILYGSAIATEALLTGESTPMWKGPASGRDPAEPLSVKRDRALVLFAGTKVVQHTADKAAPLRAPDGGCVALVLRTGFETKQGKLMRSIVFSTEAASANNSEAGLFILGLLGFAVVAAACVAWRPLTFPLFASNTASLAFPSRPDITDIGCCDKEVGSPFLTRETRTTPTQARPPRGAREPGPQPLQAPAPRDDDPDLRHPAGASYGAFGGGERLARGSVPPGNLLHGALPDPLRR